MKTPFLATFLMVACYFSDSAQADKANSNDALSIELTIPMRSGSDLQDARRSVFCSSKAGAVDVVIANLGNKPAYLEEWNCSDPFVCLVDLEIREQGDTWALKCDREKIRCGANPGGYVTLLPGDKMVERIPCGADLWRSSFPESWTKRDPTIRDVQMRAVFHAKLPKGAVSLIRSQWQDVSLGLGK